MNANFNTDVKNIVDEKIAEIFRNYLSGYQEEESREEQRIISELKTINKKIDKLTKLIEDIRSHPTATNENPIQDAQGRSNTRISARKDAVFVPSLEESDITINYREKEKMNDNQTDLSNTNFMNSLDALKKLK